VDVPIGSCGKINISNYSLPISCVVIVLNFTLKLLDKVLVLSYIELYLWFIDLVIFQAKLRSFWNVIMWTDQISFMQL